MHSNKYIQSFLLPLCIAIPYSLNASASPLPDDLLHAKAELHTVRETVESIRKKANNVPADGASSGEIQHAIDELLHAESILSGETLVGIADDTTYLQAKLFDIRSDLAHVYMKRGEREHALLALEAMAKQALLPAYGRILDKDIAFTSLKSDPRFQKILAQMQAPASMGSKSPLASPYRETLGVDEKIAGLSLFWAQARQGFVYFDKLSDLDWDKVYVETLPKVISTESTKDYYRVLMQLAPLLKDSHTNIYPPEELANAFYARPPMRTGKVGDHVLVLTVMSKSLRSTVHVGDEILEIDDQEVGQYVHDRVAPYVSSSTPQDRQVREYTYQLLHGDAKLPVKLKVRGIDGKERIEVVRRSGYSDIERSPEFEFKLLPNNIAYLALDHFESDAGVRALQAAWPQILASQGVILDVRRNGGGNGDNGFEILTYFSRDPIPSAASFQRSETALDRARGDIMIWSPVYGGYTYRHAHKDVYTGPVMVLSGPQTFSAAEDFLVAFDTMKRGKIIGQRSAGSTGQPLSFKLPGGGSARICVKRDVYPDGREFVGIGVQADVEVNPTVVDIQTGHDPVLARAIAELSARIEAAKK